MKPHWIVALGLVIGCSGKKKDDKPHDGSSMMSSGSAPAGSASSMAGGSAPAASGSAVAGGGADCQARADRLAKRLGELKASRPGFMPITKTVTAPDAAAGKPIDARGFVISIDKAGALAVQGSTLGSMKQAGEYLDAVWKSALEKWVMDGGTSRDASFPVYIWADRETPGGKVAELATAATTISPSFKVRLLVTGKPAAAAAAPSGDVAAIAAKLPAAEPDSTKYVVDQLKSSMGECKPTIMALATASIEGTAEKMATKLVTEIPKGLVECECKFPDADVFEWGMGEWFNASAPDHAYIDMPKLAKGEKQPLGKLVK